MLQVGDRVELTKEVARMHKKFKLMGIEMGGVDDKIKDEIRAGNEAVIINVTVIEATMTPQQLQAQVAAKSNKMLGKLYNWASVNATKGKANEYVYDLRFNSGKTAIKFPEYREGKLTMEKIG